MGGGRGERQRKVRQFRIITRKLTLFPVLYRQPNILRYSDYLRTRDIPPL
jgi:hypothetical protein